MLLPDKGNIAILEIPGGLEFNVSPQELDVARNVNGCSSLFSIIISSTCPLSSGLKTYYYYVKITICSTHGNTLNNTF